jgi:hypothetical protein
MDERQGEEEAVSVSDPNTGAPFAAQATSGQADAPEAEGAKTGAQSHDFPAKTKAATPQSGYQARTLKPGGLTPGEQEMVAKLQARDTAVRAHEAAHQGSGGGLVGGATFSYQSGPDGRQYAVGGEVPVDTSPVNGNMEETIAKEERVISAALAPSDPSSQDYAVAAQASQIVSQAEMALDSQRAQEAATQPRLGIAKAASAAFHANSRYIPVSSGLDVRA